MATKQSEPTRTAAETTVPPERAEKLVEDARNRYEDQVKRVQELEGQLEAETNDMKHNELLEAFMKEKLSRASKKFIYKKHMDRRIKELEKHSDDESIAALEALKKERKVLDQFKRIDAQKELDKFSHSMADLDRQIIEASNEGRPIDDLKKECSRYKYRMKRIKEEETAGKALEDMRVKLETTIKEKKITPEKRREAEKKADKDLAEAQKILDDLTDSVKNSSTLQEHLAGIAKQKGNEALPKTPEDLLNVLSKFEGFKPTIIRQKTAAAIKANEDKKKALGIRMGLDKLRELEHQIEEATKKYDDCVIKRKRTFNNHGISGAYEKDD